MQDLIMLSLLILGFAGAVGYVHACASVTGSGMRQDQSTDRQQ
jgi:hypothetical protein